MIHSMEMQNIAHTMRFVTEHIMEGHLIRLYIRIKEADYEKKVRNTNFIFGYIWDFAE